MYFFDPYPSVTVVLRRRLRFPWDVLGAGTVGASGGVRGSPGRGCRRRVWAVWGAA